MTAGAASGGRPYSRASGRAAARPSRSASPERTSRPLATKNGNSAGSSSKKTAGKADYNRGTVQNVRDIGQENSGTGGKVPTSETELAQSINHLSESLKQIAASREQPEEMLKDSDRLDLIRNSIPPAELDMLKTLFNTLQSGGV